MGKKLGQLVYPVLKEQQWHAATIKHKQQLIRLKVLATKVVQMQVRFMARLPRN
jgi:hypothetical protein